MLRRITGLFLLCVMTTVLALEQPSLMFCLCEKAFTLSECVCVDGVKPADADSCCDEAPAPACEQYQEDDHCIVSLEMDLGDFTHRGEVKMPDRADVDLLDPVWSAADFLLLSWLPVSDLPEIRGSPEPLSRPVPLFIRNSVYLI